MFSDHAQAHDTNIGHANDLRLIRLQSAARTRVRKRTQIWESPLWQVVTGLVRDHKTPEERAMHIHVPDDLHPASPSRLREGARQAVPSSHPGAAGSGRRTPGGGRGPSSARRGPR
jgi:hypothetical protein